VDKITEQLEKCYSGVVYDVLRAQGIKNTVLPNDLRPLLPGVTLCGPVFTVSGHVDESLDAHESLLQWTGFLSKAKPGHVVVCQPNDSRAAHMGELSAETFKYRGIRGYVVDGGCRDCESIISIGFQVFHRYFTPSDIVEYWTADGFDVPITIGDVEISPGDYLLGDRDGVVIVPRDKVEEITALASEAMNKENLVRKSILEGGDPQEAYIKYGKF
jgi:4-hydroxy-4-methyl-2-oxoglutarate aldolase